MNPFSWWRMLYWRFRWYIFPRRRYTTRCQYCGVPTGKTLHAWATEDVCDGCAELAGEENEDSCLGRACSHCGRATMRLVEPDGYDVPSCSTECDAPVLEKLDESLRRVT